MLSVIRSFLLAMGLWMPPDWPHWRSPASWAVLKSFGRCWNCPHENSGATVTSPVRRIPWMRSTRCCLMAEQVRRNANRITRFRESSSWVRRIRVQVCHLLCVVPSCNCQDSRPNHLYIASPFSVQVRFKNTVNVG